MLPTMKLAILAALLLPLAAVAQQTQDKQPPAAVPPVAASSLSPAIYANADLHLTFAYPRELKPADAHAVGERGHIALYGNQPDSDPEHVKSEACDKVLLYVSKESDQSKAEITIPNGGKGISVKPDPGGSILVVDLDRKCIPQKFLKKVDDLLGPLALQMTTIPGLTPIDQPLWYEIQGHRFHFSAAQGRPIAKDKKQPPYPVIMAGFAAEVNSHILVWMLESNDIDFFNRLLDSTVDLGAGAPTKLFPQHLH